MGFKGTFSSGSGRDKVEERSEQNSGSTIGERPETYHKLSGLGGKKNGAAGIIRTGSENIDSG